MFVQKRVPPLCPAPPRAFVYGRRQPRDGVDTQDNAAKKAAAVGNIPYAASVVRHKRVICPLLSLMTMPSLMSLRPRVEPRCAPRDAASAQASEPIVTRNISDASAHAAALLMRHARLRAGRVASARAKARCVMPGVCYAVMFCRADVRVTFRSTRT